MGTIPLLTPPLTPRPFPPLILLLTPRLTPLPIPPLTPRLSPPLTLLPILPPTPPVRPHFLRVRRWRDYRHGSPLQEGTLALREDHREEIRQDRRRLQVRLPRISRLLHPPPPHVRLHEDLRALRCKLIRASSTDNHDHHDHYDRYDYHDHHDHHDHDGTA